MDQAIEKKSQCRSPPPIQTSCSIKLETNPDVSSHQSSSEKSIVNSKQFSYSVDNTKINKRINSENCINQPLLTSDIHSSKLRRVKNPHRTLFGASNTKNLHDGSNTLSSVTEIENTCEDSTQASSTGSEFQSKQTFLTEFFDNTYGVTEEEVLEFARLHGIDPLQEPQLLRAARDTLLAPLPPPWTPILDEGAHAVYYYNTETEQSSWIHPLDSLLRETVRLNRSSASARSGESPPSGSISSPSKSATKTGRGAPSGDCMTDLCQPSLQKKNAVVIDQPEKANSVACKLEKKSVDGDFLKTKENNKAADIYKTKLPQSAEIKDLCMQRSDTVGASDDSSNKPLTGKSLEHSSSSTPAVSPLKTVALTGAVLDEKCKILTQAKNTKGDEEGPLEETGTVKQNNTESEANSMRTSNHEKLELHLSRAEADGESDPSYIEHWSAGVQKSHVKNIQSHGSAQMKFANILAEKEDSVDSACRKKKVKILEISRSENPEQFPQVNVISHSVNENNSASQFTPFTPEIEDKNLENMKKSLPLGPIPSKGPKGSGSQLSPLPQPGRRQLGKCLQSLEAQTSQETSSLTSLGGSLKPKQLAALAPPVTSRMSLPANQQSGGLVPPIIKKPKLGLTAGTLRTGGGDMKGPRVGFAGTPEYETTDDEEENDSYSEEDYPTHPSRPQSAARVNQLSNALRGAGGQPSGPSAGKAQAANAPSSTLRGVSQDRTIQASSSDPRATHAKTEVLQRKGDGTKTASDPVKLSSAGTMDLEKGENVTLSTGLKSVLAKCPKDSPMKIIQGNSSSKPSLSSVQSTERPQSGKQVLKKLQNSNQGVVGVSSSGPKQCESEGAAKTTIGQTGKPQTVKSIEPGVSQSAKLSSLQGRETAGNAKTGDGSQISKPGRVPESQTPKPGAALGTQAQATKNETVPAAEIDQSRPAQTPKPNQGLKTTSVTASSAAKSTEGKPIQAHSTQPKQSVLKSTTQSTKSAEPCSTQPAKPVQTGGNQPVKPAQTSTKQSDAHAPAHSSQPAAEVQPELIRPSGAFQQASTSERDSDILTGHTPSQTSSPAAVEVLLRTLLERLNVVAPPGASAGVFAGAPVSAPVGAPVGVPVGASVGASVGVPVGAPVGAHVDAPVGAPVGAPLGLHAGYPAGTPTFYHPGREFPRPTSNHRLVSGDLAQISSELEMDMGAVLRRREEELRAQHDEQMRRMVEEHGKSMDRLRHQLREKEEFQTKQSEERQSLMRDTHAAQIAKLQRQHEEELSDLKCRYRKDLEQADLQIKTDLIQKRNEWEMRLSALKTEIKSRLPDHDSGTESSSFDVNDRLSHELSQFRKQRKKKGSGHLKTEDIDAVSTFHLIETAKESVESQLKHLKEREEDVINARQQLSEKVKGLQSIIESNPALSSEDKTKKGIQKPSTSHDYEEYRNSTSRESSDHNGRKYWKKKKDSLGDKRKKLVKKEHRPDGARKSVPNNSKINALKSSDSMSMTNESFQADSNDESSTSLSDEHSSNSLDVESNVLLTEAEKKQIRDSNKGLRWAKTSSKDIKTRLDRLRSAGQTENIPTQKTLSIPGGNLEERTSTKTRGKNNPRTKHHPKKNSEKFINSSSDLNSDQISLQDSDSSTSTALLESEQPSSDNDSPKAKSVNASTNKLYHQRPSKKSGKWAEPSQYSIDDMELQFGIGSRYSWKDDQLLRESRRLTRDVDSLLTSSKLKSFRNVDVSMQDSFDDFTLQEMKPKLSFIDREFKKTEYPLARDSDSDDQQLSELLKKIRKKQQKKLMLSTTDSKLPWRHSIQDLHKLNTGRRARDAADVIVKSRPTFSSVPPRERTPDWLSRVLSHNHRANAVGEADRLLTERWLAYFGTDRIAPLEGAAGWPVRLGSSVRPLSGPVYNERASADLATRMENLKAWLRRHEGARLADGKV